MKVGNLKLNKKAIMGIGTLIIFIATILVAAVAAGVLISTSGILQQRSLITGQEARKKITNAVEIFSILAKGNSTDESVNEFEILVRLDAGSDPLQMKEFHIQYIGPTYDGAATLQNPIKNDPSIDYKGYDFQVSLPLLNNNLYVLNQDLDDDRIPDYMTFIVDNSTNYTGKITFNLSTDDAGDIVYLFEDNISMGNATDPIDIRLLDVPITGNDGLTYAYFTLIGNFSVNTSITASDFQEFRVYKNPKYGCEFDTLAPDLYYCYEVLVGNNDTVLADGEVFKLKYKLREENRLFITEEFKFILSAQKGRLTQAQARTPDIIATRKVALWPVG